MLPALGAYLVCGDTDRQRGGVNIDRCGKGGGGCNEGLVRGNWLCLCVLDFLVLLVVMVNYVCMLCLQIMGGGTPNHCSEINDSP